MQGYSNGYSRNNPQSDARIQRQPIFDPALKHFPNGFRLGEPLFNHPDIQQEWLKARWLVISHLLELIANSCWHQHLVLRGSLLLKAWLGDAAREPGDIDWVFRPKDISVSNALCKQLFNELAILVSRHPQIGNVEIETYKITIDNIWTYERAEGRRIVFPWKVQDLPPGTLQMDLVFGEEIPDEPMQTLIPASEGKGTLVWSVSKELSLAWKLLWLETDSYPQGKDLYDAVLLAQQIHLPFQLLRRVFESSEDWRYFQKHILKPNSSFPWEVDAQSVEWDDFQKEYPQIEGTASDWLTRLSEALASTFAERDRSLPL